MPFGRSFPLCQEPWVISWKKLWACLTTCWPMFRELHTWISGWGSGGGQSQPWKPFSAMRFWKDYSWPVLVQSKNICTSTGGTQWQSPRSRKQPMRSPGPFWPSHGKCAIITKCWQTAISGLLPTASLKVMLAWCLSTRWSWTWKMFFGCASRFAMTRPLTQKSAPKLLKKIPVHEHDLWENWHFSQVTCGEALTEINMWEH